MRIGIVVPGFSELVPSNELWLADGLARRGHAVTILTTSRGTARDRYLGKGPTIIPKTPPFRVVRFGAIPLGFPEAAIPLGFEQALSEGFDVLLLQEDYPPICALAGNIAHRGDVRFMVSFERYGYFAKMPVAAFNRLQDATLSRNLWKRAFALTFHSHASASFLSSIGAPTQKMYYIPAPTNCEVFVPPTRAPTNPDTPSVRILCIARLVPAKGLLVLLDAVKILVGRGVREFSVLVQGRGPLAELLRRRIRDLRIEEFIRLDQSMIFLPQLPDFYHSGDIYVQPSTYEPYGMACREAMACGLPIVASRTGGLMDAIEDGVTGLLVSPGDPEELATALGSLVQNHQKRVEYGRRARQKVEREMDLKVVALQYEQVILGQYDPQLLAGVRVSP